jgi:SNF2 family DNA or RNA helicase
MGLGKTIETVALILCNPRTTAPGSRAAAAGGGAGGGSIAEQQLAEERLQEQHQCQGADGTGDAATPAAATDGAGAASASASTGGAATKYNGGTLVVCMVSLVGQWIEEIRTKLTAEAGVSVYCYHGSSRKKDPKEISKHDVVGVVVCTRDCHGSSVAWEVGSCGAASLPAAPPLTPAGSHYAPAN